MSKKVEPFILWADSREQRIPPVPPGVVVVTHMLKEGDYTSPELEHIARIERKSTSDFASTITWGRERFDREVQRLQAFRFKAIVVEGNLDMVYRDSFVHPHAVIGSVCSFLARWDIPTIFCGNETTTGRTICGLLRRWSERIKGEADAKRDADLVAELEASLADVPSVPQTDAQAEAAMLARAEEELP